jgi:Rhodanese-related sulfurtransferase
MRIFGLMIVSTWLTVGCEAKKIDVGGACVMNSDCSGSLVCTWGKCHAICHTSADCPTGQSCIIASDQSTVCQLPTEAAAPPADAGVDALPDGATILPDGVTAGTEAAVPADASYAIDAAVSPDVPVAAAEVAALPADASVDSPTAPIDVARPSDSLLITPDVETDVAVIRMDASLPGASDAAGFEAVRVADAAPFDATKPATDLAPATLGEMSPQQLHAALAANKDFLLIDVHYPNAGSIPGTDARIAYDDIPALVAFIGPNLDTKVVLTCSSGHMSKTAGDTLAARGYRNISELTGGMSAWTAAGYSLVRLDGGM